MSTEYYSAPLWDAIQDEITEENPMPIMLRCLNSSLNGILDALAGEHVVLEGGMDIEDFSIIFSQLVSGELPKPSSDPDPEPDSGPK